MAHPEGELATSRACAKMGVNMGVSSFANYPVEAITEAGTQVGPTVHHVMQLYSMKDRAKEERIVRRAEAAGCKSIFLTADSPVLGVRYNEWRNGFKPPPRDWVIPCTRSRQRMFLRNLTMTVSVRRTWTRIPGQRKSHGCGVSRACRSGSRGFSRPRTSKLPLNMGAKVSSSATTAAGSWTRPRLPSMLFLPVPGPHVGGSRFTLMGESGRGWISSKPWRWVQSVAGLAVLCCGDWR